jgi:hypothetical protein
MEGRRSYKPHTGVRFPHRLPIRRWAKANGAPRVCETRSSRFDSGRSPQLNTSGRRVIGSPPASGAGAWRFESSRPDHSFPLVGWWQRQHVRLLTRKIRVRIPTLQPTFISSYPVVAERPCARLLSGTKLVRLQPAGPTQASSNGRTSGRLPENRGSNPRAWTTSTKCCRKHGALVTRRRGFDSRRRLHSQRPASWCGHSARLKPERTWFDSTAGHHATNALERSCPVRSEREFDTPWWPHSGACGNGSPAALQAVSLGSSPSAPTNRRLVKRRSHERPKLEVAVRFRERRQPLVG